MLMMLPHVVRFRPCYFPNANKSWFVTKTQFSSIGKKIFGDTAVNVTSDGRPHLGAPNMNM